MILAGDIGGTSTRLGLFERHGANVREVAGERYLSREYPGLLPIVREFRFAHAGPVDRATFGIAGPIRDGRVVTPNLPWVIEGAALAAELSLPRVTLLNDLEANAWGVATLAESDSIVLAAGAPAKAGNAAIIAAGTGLGEAGLFGDGAALRPFATEGGHADFAPHDELTIELYRWLRSKHDHVSWERVVSGPGLVSIFTFLGEMRGSKATPAPADAAAISQAALDGSDELAVSALDLFVTLYGAEAGNLALKMSATRGLWVGGGIAPKILPRLKQPGFLEAFCDKGRFRAFLERIPVRVILNENAALRGAAWHALSSKV